VAVGAVTALLVAGCARADGSAGGGASGSAAGDVVIGTSLPLTGPLQAFGTSLQLGYQQAVDEINAAGGLDVGGSKRKVVLDVVDNASDGNKASEQVKKLVLEDGAVALLGPATPPITIPVSVAAEQLKVPLISTITPVRAWQGANTEGWKYSFDVFFDELQMTKTQFQASDLISTNKKVALFTDQEEDGVVMGGLWEKTAPEMGYTISYRGEFPVGNTNFSSQVKEAKASGADVVIAQVIPPDGISLLREMKTQGWAPKAVFLEKAGDTGGYVKLSEGLAEGVMAANWFAAGMGLPEEDAFIAKYKDQIGGVNADLGTIVYGYSIAKVLADAIATAGSTDAAAVTEAIAKTDAQLPAGHVVFDEAHSSIMPAVQTQWAGNDQVLVLTADGAAAAEIATPVPGLK
jgi:branched-chain amino acid transport system substrate-binding protein